MELAGTPGLHPFEKHLSGDLSPHQALPKGGWASGDSACRAGMDLRLFYKVRAWLEGEFAAWHAALAAGLKT
jgi:hypothetical protein